MARLLDTGETPSSPLAREIALGNWFFDCGFRLPFAPFVRRLLHCVYLSPFQLNPNIRGEFFAALYSGMNDSMSIQALWRFKSALRSYWFLGKRASIIFIIVERGSSRGCLRWLSGKKDWFFMGSNWECREDRMPSIPRRFGGCNHQ